VPRSAFVGSRSTLRLEAHSLVPIDQGGRS
jgi:hypothetical protein